MKLCFYSSNSADFDGKTFHHVFKPSVAERLKAFLKFHPDYEIFIVTQRPSLFLCDYKNGELTDKVPGVHYTVFEKAADYKSFLRKILEIKPDTAFSFSYWMAPFDWLSLNDSFIAEKLRESGINAVSNSVKVQQLCFDKRETYNFLKQNGFNFAPSIYVNRELFWAERSRKEILNNFYKAQLMDFLKNASYPLIIKDVTGLSSYGMEVVNTFGEAKNFLESKKFNSDRLIEKYIKGFQFGCEIFRNNGILNISGPFMFSVNQYGITSPKQSVKAGPFTDEKFHISELKKELSRLSEIIDVQGSIQVDLVFDGEKWFILEINPRLSGMTETSSVSASKSVFELLSGAKDFSQKPVLDLKFPILDEKTFNNLSSFKNVLYASQTINDLAKQNRESGFCEVIIGNAEKSADLKKSLEELKESFPSVMEEVFYRKALEILDLMKE